MSITIIISVLNEERNIRKTLRSLERQTDAAGKPLPVDDYRVLVVNNGSSDKTEEITEEVAKESRIRIRQVHEPCRNIISARLAGVREVEQNPDYSRTRILAFCDADVAIPPGWINSMLANFEGKDTDVLSYNGAFPHDFWIRVPRLARRYLSELGTLFFPEETRRLYAAGGTKVKLTPRIFSDFTRPPSGGFYSVRLAAYKAAGGYRREFTHEGRELDGPTWRLYASLLRNGARLKFIPDIEMINSERRLLCAPEKFFGLQNYDQLGDLRQDYRQASEGRYAYVDSLAESVDFAPVRRYALEYYVLFPCINDPSLLAKNRRYFGALANEIYAGISDWKNSHPTPSSGELFQFCDWLTDRYCARLWDELPFEEDQFGPQPARRTDPGGDKGAR